MRSYELMTIHRPELSEDDVRSLVSGMENFLAENGAQVSNTDHWGKRRFAYEINHINEGYYSVMTFDADSPAVDIIDRALSLADTVVRHKIIRPEPH